MAVKLSFDREGPGVWSAVDMRRAVSAGDRVDGGGGGVQVVDGDSTDGIYTRLFRFKSARYRARETSGREKASDPKAASLIMPVKPMKSCDASFPIDLDSTIRHTSWNTQAVATLEINGRYLFTV